MARRPPRASNRLKARWMRRPPRRKRSRQNRCRIFCRYELPSGCCHGHLNAARRLCRGNADAHERCRSLNCLLCLCDYNRINEGSDAPRPSGWLFLAEASAPRDFIILPQMDLVRGDRCPHPPLAGRSLWGSSGGCGWPFLSSRRWTDLIWGPCPHQSADLLVRTELGAENRSVQFKAEIMDFSCLGDLRCAPRSLNLDAFPGNPRPSCQTYPSGSRLFQGRRHRNPLCSTRTGPPG